MKCKALLIQNFKEECLLLHLRVEIILTVENIELVHFTILSFGFFACICLGSYVNTEKGSVLSDDIIWPSVRTSLPVVQS